MLDDGKHMACAQVNAKWTRFAISAADLGGKSAKEETNEQVRKSVEGGTKARAGTTKDKDQEERSGLRWNREEANKEAVVGRPRKKELNKNGKEQGVTRCSIGIADPA